MTDWIDDILADEPISNSQIAIVEGLLTSVPYSEEEKQDALKSVNYDLINTCLLKAVQELAAKVEALEAKLEEN